MTLAQRPLLSVCIPAHNAALLVSLRVGVWDYYFTDVAGLALLAAHAGGPRDTAGDALPEARGARGPLRRLVGFGALAALAVFHAGFVRESKRKLDEHAATVTLCEHALRAGLVDVSEIGVAPWGYFGWHLYPYFVRERGGARESITGFVDYLAPGALVTDRTDAPLPPAATAGHVRLAATRAEGVVASGWFAAGWGRMHHVSLRRTASGQAPARRVDACVYRLDPFPLTDAEWREAARKR